MPLTGYFKAPRSPLPVASCTPLSQGKCEQQSLNHRLCLLTSAPSATFAARNFRLSVQSLERVWMLAPTRAMVAQKANHTTFVVVQKGAVLIPSFKDTNMTSSSPFRLFFCIQSKARVAESILCTSVGLVHLSLTSATQPPC